MSSLFPIRKSVGYPGVGGQNDETLASHATNPNAHPGYIRSGSLPPGSVRGNRDRSRLHLRRLHPKDLPSALPHRHPRRGALRPPSPADPSGGNPHGHGEAEEAPQPRHHARRHSTAPLRQIPQPAGLTGFTSRAASARSAKRRLQPQGFVLSVHSEHLMDSMEAEWTC